MKVCRKCKENYKEEYAFCPKCGTPYDEKIKKIKVPNEMGSKAINIIKTIINIFLYGFGVLLILAYLMTINKNPFESIFAILFGLSLFQIFYKIVENKFNFDKKVLIIARIVLPIVILILWMISFPGQSNSQKDYSVNDNSNSSQKIVEENPCITFMNEGSEYKVICVKKGEKIQKPTDPVKEGYIFSHWATHQKTIDGSELFDFNKPVTSSTDVFAHYNVSVETNKASDTKSKNNNTKSEQQDNYMNALRKCTVMEAADIYITGVGQKSDNVFNDARATCESFYDQWGEEEFIKTVNIDWKNRKNEKIEGKRLKYYLKILNW